MRITIEESYPGELDLPASELEEKLRKALAAATVGKRGGEVDVISELAGLVAENYDARIQLMTADLTATFRDG